MTFSVNGIKQENEQKHPVELLIDVEASLRARKLLEQVGILILSIKEFTQDKKTFGDIYFTIQDHFQIIECVTKYQDLQEAANFFIFCGFELKTINRFRTPITENESTMIIANAKAYTEKRKEELMMKIEEEEKKAKKVYEDQKLEVAKQLIDKVFEKTELTLKRSEGILSISDTKKIKTLVEELKKLRMGTNFEKIRDTIQELFTLLERIDNDYFASINDQTSTIAPDSLVTMTDVAKELERMEKVKILTSLGAKVSLKNQDYAIFGSWAIFRKFLQKDLILKFADLPGLLRSLYDIVELILLITLSLLGVYTLANEIYLFSVNQFGLAYMLMSVGLWGMVIFAARYFRNRNIGRLLLIIAVAILLHYLLMRAVTTNFAL